MLIKHQGKTPLPDSSAFIAPNAAICGDVRVGCNVRIMHGAQVIAENGPVSIGDNCIILENAVIRSTFDHPVSVGKNCLIGPHAHLAGCTLADNVFIATGASVFHGAVLGQGTEVRINGVVHLKSVVAENTTVPIGWVAIGDPARIFPPGKHEEIWAIQKQLNFPETVYGVDRTEQQNAGNMKNICEIMSRRLSGHREDEIIDD